MFIRRISIRSRFFILTTCSLILWLIIGFVIYSIICSYRENYTLYDKLYMLSNNTGQLTNAITGFLYYDAQTIDFYESGTSQHINKYEQVYLETSNLLQELKTIRLIQKKPLIRQKLDHYNKSLITTDSLFRSLISKLTERGYDNYGLYGHILSLTEELENILQHENNETLRNEFLELEILIKKHLENPAQTISKQLSDKLASMHHFIDSGFSGESDKSGNPAKTRIVSIYNNLDQHVQNITSIDHEIGLSQFTGIREQIRHTNKVLSEDAGNMIMMFQDDLSVNGKKTGIKLFLLLLISTAIFLFYSILLSRSLQHPLNIVKSSIKDLGLGRLPDINKDNDNDEISEITGMLSNFSNNLREKARFAGEIAKKQEDISLPLLSEEDILGNALIEMGKYLQAARIEDQKHQTESEKRRWINEGLAKIEETLRIHSHQFESLADHVIQNLVKYLDASSGVLFLTNTEDENKLDLIAAFAFDRKKYINKTYDLGEGLVGTCAIEKQKIFLTDIPDDYIQISSGLGDTKPKCLLLVPLKLEDQLLGVIEIASLNILQDHEVFFIEKIAESIASAISSVRINMRTTMLLEQSQQQARDMAEQEEKMRQHVEELQATQEESARRESEISGILNAIHNSSLVAEYNMNEELININDKFLLLLETQRDHIIGKKYHEIIGVSRHTDTYKKFWQQLREGKTLFNVEKIKLVTGDEKWIRQTYAPITDKNGVPFKILNIAIDITETKKQQESLEKQAGEIRRTNMELQSFSDAVDQALIKCVYSPAGQILEVNDNYEKATGFSRKEMIGKNNRTFLQRYEKEQFEKIWSDILKDKPYSGVIRRTKPTGEEVWIMSTYTPVKDENGIIFKVYFLGQDITERKLKYQLLEEANKEIERLKDLAGEK